MAWIKLRTDLVADPRVVSIALRTKRDRVTIIGGLYVLWSLADGYSVDGFIEAYTPEILDSLVGVEGFSEALKVIGWLEVTPAGIKVPRFGEHNGQSAKARAQTALRVKRSRNGASVTQALPDKRREEKKTSTAKPSGVGGDGDGATDGETEPEVGRVPISSAPDSLAAWARSQAKRPEWLKPGQGWVDPEVWLWLAGKAPSLTGEEFTRILKAAESSRGSLRNPAGFVIRRILESVKR